MNQRIPMTSQGIQTLKSELIKLQNTDRPKIIQAISDAREHGDLKENAEYHAAREQQSFTEGRIMEIESVLAQVQEIDLSKLNAGERIVFGAKVTLHKTDDSTTAQYQILGEYEADFKKGEISITSPLSRSLIGKKKGENIIVSAPDGDIEYTIDNVEYTQS